MPIKRDLWDYQRYHKSIPHPSNYPIISNVQITPTGLVTWTTDVASTSQVFYGFVPYLGFNTSYDSTYVTSHSVQIPNPLTGGIYYVRVQSFRYDALSISDLYTFTAPVNRYPAFIMIDSSLIRWSVIVTPTGNLDSEPTPFGPSGAYDVATIVFRDLSLSAFWTLTIDTTGHLITTPGGNPVGAIDSLTIYDTSDINWNVTVSTLGDLITS